MPAFVVQPQHQRAIERLIERFTPDPNYYGLIIGGSVAKGRARPDSDVDFILVATEEEYERRRAAANFLYYSEDFTDYPGGYVDGKVLDLTFLRDVAANGSEPARAAFVYTIPGYSRLPELDELLRRIPVYQEAGRDEKMRAFYSEMVAANWFIGEAERHSNQYLLVRFASSLALFGGRLILAHNRILYPYHKWMLFELERAPAKPQGFMARLDDVVRRPGVASAKTFLTMLREYEPLGLGDMFADDHLAFEVWVDENEWSWRRGRPPLADW